MTIIDTFEGIFETLRQIDISACNISNVITYVSFLDDHVSIAMNKPIHNKRNISAYIVTINMYT